MTEKILPSSLAVECLGDAVFLGLAENNSPQWHEFRSKGIGGSDVAVICNLSPWQSPFALWAKKTGRFQDETQTSEAMEWGTRLESVILDKFVESHPELTVKRDVGTWHHQTRSWQLANPDAIAFDKAGNGIIVEVKTARYEDDWVRGVPAYYRTQVLWYLQTFGFKQAIVVALFSGSKYREFVVDYDEFEADVNLRRAAEFQGYVVNDMPLDFDGATSTLQVVRAMHPDIDPELEVELGELYTHYQLALHDEAAAVSHANEMRTRVLAAMGKAKKGLFDGVPVVMRQSRNGGIPFLVNKKV